MSYYPFNFDYHSMWALNFPLSQNPKPYSQFSTTCLQLASFSKGLSWILHTLLKTCSSNPLQELAFKVPPPQPKFALKPLWLTTNFFFGQTQAEPLCKLLFKQYMIRKHVDWFQPIHGEDLVSPIFYAKNME